MIRNKTETFLGKGFLGEFRGASEEPDCEFTKGVVYRDGGQGCKENYEGS
jgi:hypothetical protein